MSEIKIRNLNRVTLSGLTDLATAKSVSRESYCRNLLTKHVRDININQENKDLKEALDYTLKVIEQCTSVLRDVENILEKNSLKGETKNDRENTISIK